MWLKLLSVFGLGLIGLWESVPAGFAFRLPPLVIGAVSAISAFLAALLVLLLGDRLRGRLLRRRPPKTLSPEGDSLEGEALASEKKERLIDRVWRRYGIVGLGLLAPGITGAPLGVALGLSLQAPAKRLMLWVTIGIVAWTLALTLAGMLGAAGLRRLFSH